MNVTTADIQTYLHLLTETPQRIAAASDGLEIAQLHKRRDKKTWSVNDILAHLRACADVWGGSIEAMLAEDNPTLPSVHPRDWAKKMGYSKVAFPDSFSDFKNQREQLLGRLQGFALEDWSRTAVINGRQHNIFSQTRRMALHEAQHCEQIESLLEETRRLRD